VAHPQIAIFARMAKENSRPTRVLAGQNTHLSRTMHDIRYDPVHDEYFVTNPFARAIMVFRGDAKDEDAPIRIIQGPHTLFPAIERLDLDTIHNEIYVSLWDSIAVYPMNGSGDVAPIRLIKGPDTELKRERTLAVDPVNNVIVIARDTITEEEQKSKTTYAYMWMFNRTDNGNVKPKAKIGGPKSGIIRINQIQMYPPKGEIIAAQPGAIDMQEPVGVYIGVWSIHDNGDVPPRWTIGGPKSVMLKPRGVALDPRHKEIFVADMRMNAVLTFYVPEIF
jgi:hypothetical protein